MVDLAMLIFIYIYILDLVFIAVTRLSHRLMFLNTALIL